MLAVGEVGQFIVKKETDISYTLSPLDKDLTTYVFLHFNQATRKLNSGEVIDAFLYYDQKKRLCATMEKPLITTKIPGFVEVCDINEAGVFVNIGISKDILLSSDYLPKNHAYWPKRGDFLPCLLKVKKDQLVAKIISKTDFKNPSPLTENTTVFARVAKIFTDGIALYTNDLNYIYVHKSLMRKNYHLGEEVEVKIIHINKDHEANGSFIKPKELSRIDDSLVILEVLTNLGGVLMLGNNASPDEIKKYFPMSKSAFKRAVGALYKKRLIEISDDKITLTKKQL